MEDQCRGCWISNRYYSIIEVSDDVKHLSSSLIGLQMLLNASKAFYLILFFFNAKNNTCIMLLGCCIVVVM